jgi:hypothetical protein
VGPAVARELQGGKLLRIGRVGDVHDGHGAADASKLLTDVVRHAVRGEVAMVGRAAFSVIVAFRTGWRQSADRS